VMGKEADGLPGPWKASRSEVCKPIKTKMDIFMAMAPGN